MAYTSVIVSEMSSHLSPTAIAAIVWLRRVGKAEGLSFLLLLGVAMPLKYIGGVVVAVKIAGWLHGALFMLLLIVLGAARLLAKLPIKTCGWVVVGSLLPLGPFVVDRRLLSDLLPGNVSSANQARRAASD